MSQESIMRHLYNVRIISVFVDVCLK